MSGDITYSQPLRITEFKGNDSFEVAGYVSTYGNVDHGGDVVVRGAFDGTLEAKTPIRFLFGHDSHSVLGKPLELRSDENGLFGRFQISQTQLGKDIHTLLKDGALDSFSIGYIPKDFEFEGETRLLKSVDLLECSVVAMPMNAKATVTAVKGEDKATWNSAYMNNLPDSAFAAIESGGKKDGEGKTTPRSLRHYPHHDANGKLDLPHLRAALSRIGDSSNYQGGKSHLMAHAKSEGMGSKVDDLDEDVPFEDLLGQVAEHINVAAEAAEALQQRRAEGGKRKLTEAHVKAINELLDTAEAAFERLELIANPPPPPDDGMKLRLELARKLDGHRAAVETKA